jgi:hypothetical protein
MMEKKIIKKSKVASKSFVKQKDSQSVENVFYWKDPNSLYHRAYAKPDKVKYNGRYKWVLDIRHVVRMHGLFEELNPGISEKEKSHHRQLLNNLANQCTEIYEFLEQIDDFTNVPKGFSQSFAYSISKLNIFTLRLGGFTGLIPDFQFAGARRKAMEPSLNARKKTINQRQEIIKATYPDTASLNRATAKTVIKKCTDKFIKAGIKRFSEPTINRDIKIILSK